MKKLAFILTVLVLATGMLNGQKETRNNKAYANYLIIPGSYILSYDDKFLSSGTWTTGLYNYANNTVIELGLDEDKHISHPSAIKICAKFDLELTNAGQTSTVLSQQQLDISYDPADLGRYKDKAQLVFPGYYKVKISNVSITSCSISVSCNSCTAAYGLSDVYLQAEISTQRIYNFSFSSTFGSLGSSDLVDSLTANDQLKIAWPFLAGATEYELEYTFVDDYSATTGTYIPSSALTYDLDHDATRIVTNNNHYYIPLTYEHGYIVYRLRPIGINSSLQRIEGTWLPTTGSGTVSAALHKIAINPSFPARLLNWQSEKIFAESGKTETGVSFYDAMGLPRQSLIRLNHEAKTMAQSTLFDFYGRPVVRMLPSPLSGLDFNYRFGLNVYTTSTVFDKLIFDRSNTNSFCSPASFSLSSSLSAGATKYYSPDNLGKEAFQGYLPDAEGLAFTQIQYTNDGLNQVARSTLPGKLHQLASGKEIIHRYVIPEQVQLDRIFGSEAGFSAYYQRTSTIDPNGQVSLSFSDKHGRVVASCLKGVKPPNLDQLPNITTTSVLTQNFHSPPLNTTDQTTWCKEVNVPIEIFGSGVQEPFTYQATWGSAFTNSCDPTLCFHCVYDVTLSITDDCGEQVFDHNADGIIAPEGLITSIDRQPPYSGTISCSQPTMAYLTGVSLSGPVAVTFPKPGRYNVYKKICVSNAPLDDYTSIYLNTDGCGVDKCQIYNQILNTIDFSSCLPQTCQSCYTAVTSYSSVSVPTATFLNQGPVSGGLIAGGGESTPGNGNSGTLYTSTLTPQQVSKALEACTIYCAEKGRCATYEKFMAADFYPGTGQFATTNTASPTWTLSIFNPTNSLPLSGIAVTTWSLNTLTYLNAAGQTDFVQINGANKHPYELSEAEFIQYFRKSWANAFLPKHPEACKFYFFCNMLGDAFEYDDTFVNVNHSDDACSNGGYWFPVRYGSYSAYAPAGCSSSTLGIDPVTQLSYTSNAAFATAISNFTNAITQNFRNTGRDIYEYTAMQIYTAVATSSPPTYTLGQDLCTADDDWGFFKTFYLATKQILYQDLLDAFMNSPGSFITGTLGCISSTAITSHFPDPLKALDADFPTTGTISASSFYTMAISFPGTNTASVASYTAAMSQFTSQVVPSSTFAASECSTACNSYTAGWHINLEAACPAYSLASPTTQTAILNAMTEVCKLGCDYATSLQGASSTPGGTYYTLPSPFTGTVNSFQGILDKCLPPGSCNSIVLDGPAAYPAGGVLHQLSSCKCDIILEVADSYSSTPSYSTMPEWELFEQQYGFDLPDYYKLRCACQSALSGSWTPTYSWSPSELIALDNYTVPVSNGLVCRSCISCTDVVMEIDGLTLPISIPSYSNSKVGLINHAPGNQIFVRNTLNSIFGLHPLQTYLDLYEDCASFTNTLTLNTFSNSITRTGTDLFKYLQSIFGQKNFLNTHVMTLCTDDKFYLSSLFTGTLPIIPGYTYTPVQNSNSLTIFISLSTTTLASILLVKPSGSWSNFKELRNFSAYCPPPLVSGANYGFIAEAVDNTYAAVTVTGVVTCTAWPISHLSSGTYTVPSLCPPEPLPEKNNCVTTLINDAFAQAVTEYKKNLAAVTSTFQAAYKNYCLNTLNEIFTRQYNGADEYSYTLYYYDLAGNLQRTVPPNGADPAVLSLTAPIAPSTTIYPAYSSSAAVDLSFVSDYRYDSYDQMIRENTIDGGLTNYYYDDSGRLIISQNARQKAVSTSTANFCSYTLYDGIGRITETGEAALPSATLLSQSTYSVFATAISNLTASARNQVTRIHYDRATSASSILSAFSGTMQQHLRNRVAYITYADSYNSDPAIYDHATYYSYDDHGNVTELVQHNRQLDIFEQGLRNIKYEFELISGNMLKATYQENKPDQFIHVYHYDEDNRLKEVFTSKDNINWDRDAKYFYYEHGPLARIERADKKTQGDDYFYSIHGWIKGVNSDALSKTSDAGKDGASGYLSAYAAVHSWFANDATGFNLNYYNTSSIADYKAIKTFTTADVNPLMSLSNFTNTSHSFYLDDNSSVLTGDGPDLFNGNIGSMTTSFIDKDPTNTITDNSPFPLLSGYRYDQLHRLVKAKTFRSYSASTLTWNPGSSGNYDDAYKMVLNYDNNGNITSLLRNGPGTNLSASSFSMDNLTYGYYTSTVNIGITNPTLSMSQSFQYNSNKLRCLADAISSGNYTDDIDSYTCDGTEYTAFTTTASSTYTVYGDKRYDYDATGNLIYDKGEFIGNIEWTVDRKVKKITRDESPMLSAGISPRPDIEYAYNAQRQRVTKIVKPRAASTYTLKSPEHWLYTYYVYDASGNVMATYDRAATPLSGSDYKDVLSLTEQPIYGSNRLALARPSDALASWSYTFDTSCGEDNCREDRTAGPTSDPTVAASGYQAGRYPGYKDFELTNHLGNVIATVSDRKIQAGITTTSCPNYYNMSAGVPSSIVPIGMTLSASTGSLVCTLQAGGLSGIDCKLGTNIPAVSYLIEFDWNPGSLTSSDNLWIRPFDYNGAHQWGAYYALSSATLTPGHHSILHTPVVTGSNVSTYLGIFTYGAPSTHTFIIDNLSICPVNSPPTVNSYSPDILSHTDYYPGGMQMPGRTYVGGDEYRYSHNGHEREDEIYANAQSAENWMYDSRIIRRWEIDPVVKEWESPYAAFNNNPIYYSDPLGLDGEGNGDKGGKGEPTKNNPNQTNLKMPEENPNLQPNVSADHLDPVQINQLPADATSVREPNVQIQNTSTSDNPSISNNPTSTNPNFMSFVPFSISLPSQFAYWFVRNEITRLQYGIQLYGTGTGGEMPTEFKHWKGPGYAESFADLVNGVGKMKRDHTKQINGKTVSSGKGEAREYGYKDGQKKMFGGTGEDASGNSKPAIGIMNADTVAESGGISNQNGRYPVIKTFDTKDFRKNGHGAGAKSASIIVNGDTIPLK